MGLPSSSASATSVRYSRGVAVSLDYVRMLGRDMFLNPNLNIRRAPIRCATVRERLPIRSASSTAVSRPAKRRTRNVIRLRTTKYAIHLRRPEPVGRTALREQLEPARRDPCSYSRGVTAGQENTPDLQVGSDLKLDEWYAPSGTDRTHNFRTSGRIEMPKTRGLALSGTSHGERDAVHDSGRHCRHRHESHQLRAAAGGHLQPVPRRRATS